MALGKRIFHRPDAV